MKLLQYGEWGKDRVRLFPECLCAGFLAEEFVVRDGTTILECALVALSVVGSKHLMTRYHADELPPLLRDLHYVRIALPRPGVANPSPVKRDDWIVCEPCRTEFQVKSRPVPDKYGWATEMQQFVLRHPACDASLTNLSEKGACFVTGAGESQLKRTMWSWWQNIPAPAPEEWCEAIWALLEKRGALKKLAGFSMAGVRVEYTEAMCRQLLSESWIAAYREHLAGRKVPGGFSVAPLLRGRDLRDKLAAGKAGS
jgi:hypothetical protein